MKIEVRVSTNRVGSECKRTVEVDDDSTPEQIEEIAQQTMFEMIDWSWEEA